MYWIDDLKEKYDTKDIKTVTFEVVSEAHITGVLSFYKGNLLIGPLVEAPKGGLNPYQVKIKKPSDQLPHDYSDSSEDAYFHPQGIIGELVALLSVFYRTRFYITSFTAGELTPRAAAARRTYEIIRDYGEAQTLDEELFTKKDRNFTDFAKFLDQIKKLPDESHLQVITACTHYNRALLEIGIDEEIACIKLVLSLEVLSRTYELAEKDDLLKLETIEKFLATLPSSDRKEVSDIIKTRKTTLRFVRFVEKHAKGCVPDESPDKNFDSYTITMSKLPAVLKSIYRARSKYLHEGAMMYIGNSYPGYNFDTDPSVGMYIGKKKFTKKDKLPNLQFMERMTHHCILSFIEQL